MSATTTRRTRHNAETDQTSGNGADEAAAVVKTLDDVETTDIEIKTDNSAVTLTLPNKFELFVGQPLTEDQARIIFAHVAGQFRNNQVANAKARMTRLAALGDKATDAQREENRTWGVDDYLKLWPDYQPTVLRGTRQSTMDKLRNDAAWRVMLLRIDASNKDVAAGGQGMFKGTLAGQTFVIPTGKGSVAFREQCIANVLSKDSFAPQVQEQLDMLIAENASKSKKETKGAVSVSAEALFD